MPKETHMNLRKFQGPTMRDALAAVRREIGADALVIATREVRHGLFGRGVEVTAALDEVAPAASALSEEDAERIMAPLRADLRSLRAILRPIAEQRPLEELREELRGIRHAVGHRDRVSEVPLTELAASGHLAAPSQGRIVILVGPTGVGKTTTIAKLAARASLVMGLRVALVSLDTYRIGCEDQIRAFADLMGVPLTIVAHPEKLGATLSGLSHFDRIYVDTAGRSPRDPAAMGPLDRAFQSVPTDLISDLELHLTLHAASQPGMVVSCLERYRPLGIDRLLFTKIDEADDLSEIVRAPVRHELPISYITTGQRVPEDLEEPTAQRLLELATSGFPLQEVAA